MKYGELTLGQIEAVINKLGGMDGVRRFLSRSWRKEDGVIHLSPVISDGTTGSEWIERLGKKGFRVSRLAEDVLRSSDFEPTSGVKYKIEVLCGNLFENNGRTTENIRVEANHRSLSNLNTEAACLIQEKLSDEELDAMGLDSIVVMHEPINDPDGASYLLSVRRGDDSSWLDAYYGLLGCKWGRVSGFAFVASQD